MKKIKILFVAIATLVTALAYAQNITVKGVVSDGSSNEAVPFAAVQLKGTMVGTAADADGNYVISVPANGTLVFSAVGYITKEVAVQAMTSLNVTLLPDSESLEDVVVVAYGTAKKSSFTGSASTVSSESLKKRSVANVTKAIEGLVAGISTTSGSGQPGSGVSIQVRGTGSISASSSPLYVVDGIPFDGDLASINPADIENLTVLKDASASALYGSRGANGVVMITTKRGSEGKANVNFKAQVGFESRSLKRYDVVNQDQFVELTWEALKNGYVEGGYPDDVAKALASNDMSSNLGGQFYNPYKNYTWDTVIDPATGLLRADAKSAYTEDWMDELTNKKAVRQEYQVGVNGGDSKTKYNFSVGYLDEQGILVTTKFKRYSMRAGVDHSATNWLALGANVSYAYTNSNQSQYSNTQTGNAWYTAQFMAPIYPIYLKNADGTDALDAFGNRQYDYGENGRPKANNFNALGDLHDNMYETLADNSSARGYLVLGGNDSSLGALQGLTLTFNVGADIRNANRTSYYSPFHGDGKSVNGEVDKYGTRSFSYTVNEILKYDRKFGKHHVLAQLGHENYQYNYKYLYAERTGVYPGIAELAPSVSVTGNNSYSDIYKIESVFGRLSYDFADKYYLEATWRSDGSSRFHKDARWGQFWSLGGSWRVSQENFMANAGWVDNLTLRASYGQLGNDDLGSYYAWQSFYDLTWPNANNSGAVISSLENKNVSWEKKGTFNAGIDATLFSQKLNVVLEYYYGLTDDMLLSSPLAMSTGFTGFNDNMGSMSNRGFEATIKYNWLNSSKLRASSTLMTYMNRNKVIKLNGDDKITSGSQVIEIGLPIYTYYMVKTAGVDPATGQQLYWAYKNDEKTGEKVEGSDFVTNDKTVATNHRYYMGSREPKFQGSFSTDFQYGPFDFSFLTTFSVGGKMYDSVYASALEAAYAGDTWSSHVLRRWQKPGDVTDVPKVEINSGNTVGDRALVDASYFAIKSIQLGYTLPQKWTNKAGIKALRVFALADNIRMFNRLNGMDPQYSLTGGSNWSYTPTKTISFGVDLTF